jgi:hypothetical protein
MHLAALICSDEECASEIEEVGTLEELDALACDCGCAWVVLSLSEVEEAHPALRGGTIHLLAA